MPELKNSINDIIAKLSPKTRTAIENITADSTKDFGNVERSIVSKRISDFFQRLDQKGTNPTTLRSEGYSDFFRDYSDFRDYYDHDVYHDYR